MTGSDEGAQSGTLGTAMSPAQSRAARGLLGWSEADLAVKVGLDEQFVRDFEGGYRDPPAGQVQALRTALVAGGATFTDSPTPGVCLAAGRSPDEGTRLEALTTENDR